jgi:hypothetical protein
MDERCADCGRDVALGTPLFRDRVTLISQSDPDTAFICVECRRTAPVLDEHGNVLSEEQLAGLMYVVGRGGRA